MAVANAREAAPFIIQHGLSVAPMGGYSGRDPAVTEAGFASMVEEGRLQYVMLSRPDEGVSRSYPGDGNATRPHTSNGFTRGNAPVSGSSRPAGATVMFDYVEERCRPVTDAAVPLRFRSGEPDEPGQSTLYDCAPT
jgi:hypothetical protein